MNNIDILEELKAEKMDLIQLLRTFKREGIENFITIRREKFETLIAENKELKDRNKRQQENLKITNKKIAAQRGQLMMLNKAYIPKSKVEEIIHNNKPHIAQEKLQSLLGKE